jgi:hypothetical protein
MSAIAVLTVCVCASPPAAGQVLSVPEDSAEVRARERALAEAMHESDRRRLEALLAPDYVLRATPDIDRETWIGNAIAVLG